MRLSGRRQGCWFNGTIYDCENVARRMFRQCKRLFMNEAEEVSREELKNGSIVLWDSPDIGFVLLVHDERHDVDELWTSATLDPAIKQYQAYARALG